MPLKADWNQYLHAARTREIRMIFGSMGRSAFPRALELGAGDGFQSRLIAHHAGHLISTDMDAAKLPPAAGGVEYRVLDAEEVGSAFPPGSFDLVFSSNLLEHLPRVDRALRGIHRVLANDGVAIHIMPGPFWKFLQLALFAPDLAIRLSRHLTDPDRRRRALARATGGGRTDDADGLDDPNNLKTPRRSIGWFAKTFVPHPHGVSETNLREFSAFSRRRWIREMEDCGFAVRAVRKGPVLSGYGFGWDRVRGWFESLGFTSEYVYYLEKAGHSGRWLPGLLDAPPAAAASAMSTESGSEGIAADSRLSR